MIKLKPYHKYKDSGIAWLGEIPEHWEVRKAKKLFKERSEKGYENEPFLAATQSQGVVLKNMLDIKTVLVSKDFHTLKLVEKGDFVISLRSFQGGIEYAYYRGIISPAYTILSPKVDVERGYFRYYFKSKEFINCLTLLVTGIREGQNIDTAKFKDTFLPLPTNIEQTAIANFLDYKTAKIDRFIFKKKQLIKLLNEQKAGIINDAVTKGLNANAKMKPSGIEWLGDIPEAWEVRKLKYVAEILRGKFTPRPRNDPKFYDGQFPFVQTGNVATSEKYIETYTQTLNEFGYEVSKEFPANSVVMTIAANIADVAILKFDACFPDSIIGFKPFNNINVEFLYYQLKNLRSHFFKIAIKSTQYNLNVERVQSVYINLPTLSEQTAIVSHIEKETAIINKTIVTIEKEIALVQEYRTALIAEAVTGKIDVRDFVAPEVVEEESYEELEEDMGMVAEDGEKIEIE